jgi:DNA-binding IclR family transcriptional regulator
MVKKDVTGDAESPGPIVRVIRLLRCFAEADDDLTISDISRQLELAPSTTHRLLKILIDEGMVDRPGNKPLYRPGLEFVRVGTLVSRRLHLSDIAKPFLQAVVDETGETCMLVQPLPHQHKVMVTAAVIAPHPLRYEITMFQGSSMVRGATGRTILAFMPPEEIDAAIAADEPERGLFPPINKEVLLEDLASIRARGYAVTHAQKIQGAVGIGAPVLGSKNEVLGALCVTLPEFRFSEQRGTNVGAQLKIQARELERMLGRREK